MLDDSLRRMCISLRSVVIQIFWWMCRRKMPYTECTYYKPKCINTTQTPITVSIKTSSYYLQYRWWQFLLYFRNIVSIQFPLRLSISLNRVVVLYTFTQLGCVYTYIQWKKNGMLTLRSLFLRQWNETTANTFISWKIVRMNGYNFVPGNFPYDIFVDFVSRSDSFNEIVENISTSSSKCQQKMLSSSMCIF